MENHSRLLGPDVSYKVTKKMKCCEYNPWVHIHNTLYSSQFTNGPKQVDCYIILGQKNFLWTNTLGYSIHVEVVKTFKFCEYGPWVHIYNTSFSL